MTEAADFWIFFFLHYQREFGSINLFLKSFDVRTCQQNNFYLVVECAWQSKPRREVPHSLVVVYKSIKLFLMILPRRCKYQLYFKLCTSKNKQNQNKFCKRLTRGHNNPYLFLASWCPKGRNVPDNCTFYLHIQLYGQVFTCLRKTT